MNGGTPLLLVLLFLRAVAHKSDIPSRKLPKEITLTILMYSMHFAEVKNLLFSLVMDLRRLTIKEVIREPFMDRDIQFKKTLIIPQ